MDKEEITKWKSLEVLPDNTIEDLLWYEIIKKAVLELITWDEVFENITDFNSQLITILSDEVKLYSFMATLSNSFSEYDPKSKLIIWEVIQSVKDLINRWEFYGLDFLSSSLWNKVFDTVWYIHIDNPSIEHFSLWIPFLIDIGWVNYNVEINNGVTWEYQDYTYHWVTLTTNNEDEQSLNHIGRVYINPEKWLMYLNWFWIPVSHIEELNVPWYEDLNIVNLLNFDANTFVSNKDLNPIIIGDLLLQFLEPEIEYNWWSYSRMTFVHSKTKEQISYFCNKKYEPLIIDWFNKNVTDIDSTEIQWLWIVNLITFDDESNIITNAEWEIYKVDWENLIWINWLIANNKSSDESWKIGNAYLYIAYIEWWETYYVDENMTVLRDSNIFSIITWDNIKEDNENEYDQNEYDQNEYNLTNVLPITKETEVTSLDNTYDIVRGGLKFVEFWWDLVLSYNKWVFTSYWKRLWDPYDNIWWFQTILWEEYLVIDKAWWNQILLNCEHKTLLYKWWEVNSVVHNESYNELSLYDSWDKQVWIWKKGYIKIAYNYWSEVSLVPIRDLHFG